MHALCERDHTLFRATETSLTLQQRACLVNARYLTTDGL